MAVRSERCIGLILCCIYLVAGHTYLMSPSSWTDQATTETACRYGDNAKKRVTQCEVAGQGEAPCCPGPCDTPKGSVTPIAATRGESIQLMWNCDTHPGGFVRLAWALTAQSTVHANFDAQVDRYVCKEIGGCNALTSTSVSDTLSHCTLTYTIPTWLSDGAWTLQWAYFGGYFNAGDYYACADYTISGGSTLTTMPTTVFVGGDVATTGSAACRFYATDALHTCTVEPCTNGTKYNPSAGLNNVGPYTGPPRVYANGQFYAVGVAVPPSGSSSASAPVPCSSNANCKSGTCMITGYCYVAKSSFGAGGVAAVVFALLAVALIAGIAVLLFLNRAQLAFVKPFKFFMT